MKFTINIVLYLLSADGCYSRWSASHLKRDIRTNEKENHTAVNLLK